MKLFTVTSATRLASVNHKYDSKPLLSSREGKFCELLSQVCGDRVHLVCKPRLADFIKQSGGNAHDDGLKLAHVDFLLCRKRDWVPMLGIALENSPHPSLEQRKQDTVVTTLFTHARIPLLRVGYSEVDDDKTLVEQLTAAWKARTEHLSVALPS